jgi:hypothetical protein
MSNNFELEILPDSMNRIKSRGLLTWACILGILYLHPYFVFTGIIYSQRYWTRRLQAHGPEDPGRPKLYIRQCDVK